MNVNMRGTAAALSVLAVALTVQGCGFVNQLRSKNVLNEGVRTFNGGKYDEAQQQFEEALSYDPDNQNAKFFLAMSLNAQYEKARNSQNIKKEETVDLGNKTIQACEDVIASNPSPQFLDRAYGFIANTYKTLADQVFDPKDDAQQVAQHEQKYLDYIQKRAELPDQTGRVRAQMYYTLADHYWREGRETILNYEKKDPANPMAPVSYDPVPADRAATIQAALAKAHEYNQKAIETDPTYPEPYIGEKLVYMEEIKLVQNDQAKRDQIKAQVDAWDEKYRERLSAQQEADATAATAAPPEGAAGQ